MARAQDAVFGPTYLASGAASERTREDALDPTSAIPGDGTASGRVESAGPDPDDEPLASLGRDDR